MNIAVFIKQVPAESNSQIDENTKRLIRGDKNQMNVYDYAAIEAALFVKQMHAQTKIDCFTMGPKNASHCLKEALALGADNAYLINDSLFAGSDALATSKILADAISSVSKVYSLIFCGTQSTDGGTGQVAGELAAQLNWLYINGLQTIAQANAEKIELTQNLGLFTQQIIAPYPMVISCKKDAFPNRLPSLKAKLAARKKEVETLTKNQLPLNNQALYGSNGSPTKVKNIFSTARPKVSAINTDEPAIQANKIVQLITKDMKPDESKLP